MPSSRRNHNHWLIELRADHLLHPSITINSLPMIRIPDCGTDPWNRMSLPFVSCCLILGSISSPCPSSAATISNLRHPKRPICHLELHIPPSTLVMYHFFLPIPAIGHAPGDFRNPARALLSLSPTNADVPHLLANMLSLLNLGD